VTAYESLFPVKLPSVNPSGTQSFLFFLFAVGNSFTPTLPHRSCQGKSPLGVDLLGLDDAFLVRTLNIEVVRRFHLRPSATA